MTASPPCPCILSLLTPGSLWNCWGTFPWESQCILKWEREKSPWEWHCPLSAGFKQILEKSWELRTEGRIQGNQRLVRCIKTLESVVLSFLNMWRANQAAALLPCPEKKAAGQNLLLEFPSSSTSIPPTQGHLGWAMTMFGGTHPQGCGCPRAGHSALVPAAPPTPSAKNDIFHQLLKSPASALMLILGVFNWTLATSFRNPRGSPEVQPHLGDRVCFLWQYGFNNQASSPGNHFPQIAAK